MTLSSDLGDAICARVVRPFLLFFFYFDMDKSYKELSIIDCDSQLPYCSQNPVVVYKQITFFMFSVTNKRITITLQILFQTKM